MPPSFLFPLKRASLTFICCLNHCSACQSESQVVSQIYYIMCDNSAIEMQVRATRNSLHIPFFWHKCIILPLKKYLCILQSLYENKFFPTGCKLLLTNFSSTFNFILLEYILEVKVETKLFEVHSLVIFQLEKMSFPFSMNDSLLSAPEHSELPLPMCHCTLWSAESAH